MANDDPLEVLRAVDTAGDARGWTKADYTLVEAVLALQERFSKRADALDLQVRAIQRELKALQGRLTEMEGTIDTLIGPPSLPDGGGLGRLAKVEEQLASMAGEIEDVHEAVEIIRRLAEVKTTRKGKER